MNKYKRGWSYTFVSNPNQIVFSYIKVFLSKIFFFLSSFLFLSWIFRIILFFCYSLQGIRAIVIFWLLNFIQDQVSGRFNWFVDMDFSDRVNGLGWSCWISPITRYGTHVWNHTLWERICGMLLMGMTQVLLLTDWKITVHTRSGSRLMRRRSSFWRGQSPPIYLITL